MAELTATAAYRPMQTFKAMQFSSCTIISSTNWRSIYFSVLIFLTCFSEFVESTEFSSKPNIVLIVSDDHGLDAVGAYGNNIVKTPNLDRLASLGAIFTNAFATTASCSPSRSVLLTGLHNHANGMYGLMHWENHFSAFDNVISLPVLLSQGGYRTARVGKYHLAPKQVFKFDVELSEGRANDMSSVARSPHKMAELAQKFVKKEGPFFLYFAPDDPHRAFPFDTYPEPNNFGNRPQGYPGITPQIYSPEEVIVPEFLPDTRATREELAEYYQSVSRMDQGIGRLLGVLEENGKLENTLIIYLSDNGIAFQGAKTTLYNPAIHLPLIIKTPFNQKGNRVIEAMVSWVDIAPTILDYAKITTPDVAKMHGKSFRTSIEINNSARTEIYASHTFHEVVMYYPMRMVQNNRYKLIWNIANTLPFPLTWDLQKSTSWQQSIRNGDLFYGKRSIKNFIHRPEFELYDLKSDPNELNNLADDPKHKSIREQLVTKIKAFQKRTNDPWFRKWEYR